LQKTRTSTHELKGLLNSAGLNKKQLVCPLLVKDYTKKKIQLPSLPGLSILSIEETIEQIRQLIEVGISSVIIFGIPSKRDYVGSEAWNNNGVVQKMARELKVEFGDAVRIITDVCLCQYNLSGHCGIFCSKSNDVENDRTLCLLRKIAVSHAEAGVDVVAPSSMMDGQVGSIREALDDRGYNDTKIFSYSAKHLSSLYLPFRSVAFFEEVLKRSRLSKSSYQVGYTNPRESLVEAETDMHEGADMVIVKPANIYLDIIARIKEMYGYPIAAQDVSGEYAMIRSAASNNWINLEEWKVASIYSMKRAGADIIISYLCRDIAAILDF
jgi:porphobilinogen synthase